MQPYHLPLVPNKSYHLFSRAVGNEKLFLGQDNYLFFLQKLKHHTSAVCSIYCYSLLPNHFHLFAKINDEETIAGHFEEVKNIALQPHLHSISDFVMERFSNFLNSYTKAFNKVNNRKGALFMDYLKRSEVQTDGDFTSYMWYVHKNAVHHGLASKVGEWPYDSYRALLSEAATALLRDEVLGWFGGKQAFIQFHQQTVYPKIGKLLDDVNL